MNKKERKEFMQEADRLIEKLANVLVEEGDKELYKRMKPTPFIK